MSVLYKKAMARGKVDPVPVKTRQASLARFHTTRERISYLDSAELKELSTNAWTISQSLLEMERKATKVSSMHSSSARSVHMEELSCSILFTQSYPELQSSQCQPATNLITHLYIASGKTWSGFTSKS